MPVSVIIKTRDTATGALEKWRVDITPGFRKLQEKVAWVAQGELVRKTPKGFTGNTRRAWQIVTTSKGGKRVVNISKVMTFLEKGTKAHGSTSGGPLYIPLTRRASFGWRPGFRIGRDYVLAMRVRGIKAMKIAEKVQKKVPGWIADGARLLIASQLRRFNAS